MKINVDPAYLESSAAHIDAMNQQYEKEYQHLYQEVELLKIHWKGQDNQTFIQQIKGFEHDFIVMRKLMEQYASYLRSSASAYRSVQQQQIAQARKLVRS